MCAQRRTSDRKRLVEIATHLGAARPSIAIRCDDFQRMDVCRDLADLFRRRLAVDEGAGISNALMLLGVMITFRQVFQIIPAKGRNLVVLMGSTRT